MHSKFSKNNNFSLYKKSSIKNLKNKWIIVIKKKKKSLPSELTSIKRGLSNEDWLNHGVILMDTLSLSWFPSWLQIRRNWGTSFKKFSLNSDPGGGSASWVQSKICICFNLHLVLRQPFIGVTPKTENKSILEVFVKLMQLLVNMKPLWNTLYFKNMYMVEFQPGIEKYKNYCFI